MKISNSSGKLKRCIRCRKNIYRFEKRKDGRNGRVFHLKDQCNAV